jgi:ATP-dependent DNA ligase
MLPDRSPANAAFVASIVDALARLRSRCCIIDGEAVACDDNGERKDSPYRSGRSRDLLKMKNANAPAVKREAEEDWGKGRWR